MSAASLLWTAVAFVWPPARLLVFVRPFRRALRRSQRTRP